MKLEPDKQVLDFLEKAEAAVAKLFPAWKQGILEASSKSTRETERMGEQWPTKEQRERMRNDCAYADHGVRSDGHALNEVNLANYVRKLLLRVEELEREAEELKKDKELLYVALAEAFSALKKGMDV